MSGRDMAVAVILWMSLLASPVLSRPPLKQKTAPSQPETAGNGSAGWDLGIEYNRYLQEVVQVLESDPEFRRKLESADVDRIRDGSIAHELDFVGHHIRSKLDDIKRKELDRLRQLAMAQFERSQGIDRKHAKMPLHLETRTPTFEKEDLMRLIRATTQDLEEADRKRRVEFKSYEMEKKFRQEERLKHIDDETKRAEEEKRMREAADKHKKHAKPHHPMTKDQLEEVWEKQDHMRPQDWDPKTFFAMHDLNGDGMWDEDEIRMLFKKELDKVYDPNAPEDDMREREEEMERMREHVFKESDANKDRLISFEEFLAETKREEFKDDQGWDTIDQNENEVFTDEDWRAYELQRQREIQDMINRGQIPSGYPYYGDVPPGAAPYHQPQMGIPGQPAYKPPHPGNDQQFGGHPQQPLGYPQQPQYAAQPQQFAAQQNQYPAQPQQQQYAAQPQHQQQQFAAQPQQPQQFAAQPQQQQYPAQPQQQQFAAQPQQQQYPAQPQQQQFAAQPQQQQQYPAQSQQGNVQSQNSAPVSGQQPAQQANYHAPQPQGQPPLRKTADAGQAQPQQQQAPQHNPQVKV